jgi:glycolate oxidase iron-sulfur subunit
MQTHLADFIRDTPAGREAESILRSCVHCGFCTATCPTYQLLGDELDGPRGRIYLIKQMLEGGEAGAATRLHLDRCLTCRSCETTCPSGVRYSRLLDIGRAVLAERLPRGAVESAKRLVLREGLTQRPLVSLALRLGRAAAPLLPEGLRAKLPAPRSLPPEQRRGGTAPQRQMIALAGCVQPDLAPSINEAARRVLERLGIALIEAPRAGCCGALRFHLDDVEGARDDARRNIDAWWPLLERGSEGLVMTASGCGVQVRDYGHLLGDDERYAAKAARVAGATRDVAEVLLGERDALRAELARLPPAGERVAFHAPCTLQHGQKVRGVVEELLQSAGFELTPVADAHLCCGSAGTYSLLQPELALRLRDGKLAALQAGEPARIATANIGCLAHLAAGSRRPVLHWIELIAERLAQSSARGE